MAIRIKFFILLFIFVSGISGLSCTSLVQGRDGGPVRRLVVLHTNDTHGHPVKFYNYPGPDAGGIPARATIIKEIRKSSKNVLLLDAGDINTGRVESNYFKAEPDIIGFNALGYDAMTLGNHEFDNPLSVLKSQMEKAEFPFLSSNIRTRDRKLLARPYIIKKFKGFNVAVFGLTTRSTRFIGNPESVGNLYFENEIKAAKRLVPELRKKADIVIALTHMGIYEHQTKGSRKLGIEVPGIDLIVDGHSHTKLNAPVIVKNRISHKDVVIVQAWKWGLILGRVDLKIQDRSIIDVKFRSIPINLKVKESGDSKKLRYAGKKIGEDKNLVSLFKPYLDKVEKLMTEVIGRSDMHLFNKYSRERETAIGNLVADSMLWATRNLKVDFALQNSGGIRADLPEGDITRGTIHEILPFDNTVIVLTMKGSQLISLFDRMSKVRQGSGAFPQVSKGVRLVISKSGGTAAGDNDRGFLIKGKPVDPNRTYRIATNSYLARGGDGYRIFKQAIDEYDTSMIQRDVLIDYINHLGGKIKAKRENRIILSAFEKVFKKAA